jgi:succinate dehydrogenase flavin-adding protein (antitoxin of CptAB toxin-antitoxin module)
LELDIVLQKFINNRLQICQGRGIVQLDALLDYPDNDFWDLVSDPKKKSQK